MIETTGVEILLSVDSNHNLRVFNVFERCCIETRSIAIFALNNWVYIFSLRTMNNNSLQVIQPGTSFSAATPLFLIHDAGGTLYSYYSLGDLQRPVYGIVNPHFDSGAPWEGGISEMAQSYYTMIRRQVRKGDVLLGGKHAIA